MASQPSLVDLLQASVAATSVGDHATSWRLTSQFGTQHWLSDPDTDLPADTPMHLRTEFHVLRAAVSDRLELHEEAAEAVFEWRHLARDNDDHASAVLANSALCLVAMVVESDGVDLVTLPPAAHLLEDLQGAIMSFRPTPEGPTVATDPTITGHSLPRHQATCLSLAAMGGLTCATSLATPETAPLRPVFRALADRFTVGSVSPGDRELTRAQQLHADGDITAAVTVATGMLASESPTTRYEAHDLLGYFALTSDDSDSHATVLEHWRQCAEIALELGAPLEGMHRAEQACQLLNAEGDYAAAYDLAVRVDEAAAGAPISPALLNLRAVRARAAIGVGNLDEGLSLAVATADWSLFTPDSERTLACLTMACVAASSSGQHVVTAGLLERSCALYRDLDRPLAAAQALRTGAREHLNVGDTSRAVELMERSRRILEEAGDDPMLSWHLGDWNEDMSAIWEDAGREDLALEYATRAAHSFTEARDHSSAAMNWVAAASLYLERGEDSSCDVALDRAHGELLLVPEETGLADGTDAADATDEVGVSDSDLDGSVWQAYRELRDLRGQ
ncbi:Hypothetical protein CGLY_09540 [Corynebacterium glyciniphilum AJ 3170]|uniref:Uncharacterized protein n=1 Tax=Corynebacterium glyciniphilum AJ 3170 TaxID=1404245 RepID=X5DML5_9CORY|nr:hypothetical protein [Corynebacterium glyciniphilum]AHW64353.1 Hypothetical protein CGLY_09540 [Corynebacterium glyciniphilum AJ 3170]